MIAGPFLDVPCIFGLACQLKVIALVVCLTLLTLVIGAGAVDTAIIVDSGLSPAALNALIAKL